MSESTVGFTPGSGGKFHSNQRSISGNTVEELVGLNGEPYRATYNILSAATLLTTANSHTIQIMAGASLIVYLRRLQVFQLALATTATICLWELWRLSTAGTGGTALARAALDSVDSASGATGMSLPTSKGTESTQLWHGTSQTIQTVGTGGAGANTLLLDVSWDHLQRSKMPRIPAGTSNGIALKQVTGVSPATVVVVATISEAID